MISSIDTNNNNRSSHHSNTGHGAKVDGGRITTPPPLELLFVAAPERLLPRGAWLANTAQL